MFETAPEPAPPAAPDSVLSTIAEACDALGDMTRRTQPVTPAAAMAIARRELSRGRPGRAFRTRDRLRVELVRFGAEAARTPPTAGEPEDPAAKAERVLGAGEVALILVAALAHGGDETTDNWWFGSIASLARAAGDRGGDVRSLVDLTRAPPVLVLYAGGVAATAAGRWSLVGRLLTEPRFGYRRVPVATAFGLDDVGLLRGAKLVNETLATLFADHLAISGAPFTRAWERFEYLVLLAAGQLEVRGTMLQPYWRTRLRADGRGHPAVEPWFRSTVGDDRDHPLYAILRSSPGSRPLPRRRPATDPGA